MGLSPFVQKLLFIKKFDISEGVIEILNNKYIMLDASDLLTLQEVDESKMYEKMKENFKAKFQKILLEHAKVYQTIKEQELRNIAELSQKLNNSDEGIMNLLQKIFNTYGLGKMEMVNLDNKKTEAVIKINQSTIAQEYLNKYNKKSKEKVCVLTSGILAGTFSFLFEKNIDCFEEKCLAQGHDHCLFRLK